MSRRANAYLTVDVDRSVGGLEQLGKAGGHMSVGGKKSLSVVIGLLFSPSTAPAKFTPLVVGTRGALGPEGLAPLEVCVWAAHALSELYSASGIVGALMVTPGTTPTVAFRFESRSMSAGVRNTALAAETFPEEGIAGPLMSVAATSRGIAD